MVNFPSFSGRGYLPEGEMSMLTSVTISLMDSTIFLRMEPSARVASNIFACLNYDYNLKNAVLFPYT
jgi:hypothetical protein